MFCDKFPRIVYAESMITMISDGYLIVLHFVECDKLPLSTVYIIYDHDDMGGYLIVHLTLLSVTICP